MIASVALILIALIAVLIRLLPLRKHYRKCLNISLGVDAVLSPAAVVVFAHDDAESVAEMLPQVLAQQYAPGFEVIVVNDGESLEVRHVVESLMQYHRNLYYTVAPDGARNLSRKKLALTLGVKAAKAPVVIHTTSSARIPSSLWLESIMRHFDPEGPVDIVIGYAAAPAYDDRALGARARSFDNSADALGWIAPAVAGHPWRGTEFNLAYRRDIFFRNKGFSQHLNLRDGDDDIFISEIAQGYNTVVELSDNSVVEVPGDNSPRALADRMGRRRFTKRFISSRPRIIGTLYTVAYFLAPWPLVAVPFVGPVTLTAWLFLAAIVLCWYASGLVWNPAVAVLRGRRLRFSTPLLAFTRPFRICSRTVNSMLNRGKRYTWE